MFFQLHTTTENVAALIVKERSGSVGLSSIGVDCLWEKPLLLGSHIYGKPAKLGRGTIAR